MVTSFEKKEILGLLKTSTIDDHQKKMVRILLDVMADEDVKLILKALKNEARQMEKLNKREDMAKLKYKMSVEKLDGIGKDVSK